MSEPLVKYLRQCGQPATATELAAAVLHMKNIPGAAAVSIISALLDGHETVQRVSEDTWIYKPACALPGDETTYLLCRAVPPQCANWREWRGFGCTLWCQERILFSACADAADRAEFIRSLTGLFNQVLALSPAFVVFDGFGNQISLFTSALMELLGQELDAPFLSIRRLTQQWSDAPRFQTPAQLAHFLGQRLHLEGDIQESVADLQALWEYFMARAQESGSGACGDFCRTLLQPAPAFDYTPYGFDADVIRLIPPAPGVYLMRDRGGEVIYVGKSKNLSRRLSGYFAPGIEADAKLSAIRERLHRFDYQLTGTELDALLLEYEAIRAFDPPINRQLQVRMRPQRQRSRYARAVILPAADAGFVRVFLLHPEWGLHHCWLGDGQAGRRPPAPGIWPLPAPEAHVAATATALYEKLTLFLQGLLPASLELAELAYSWLGQNEEAVNSIDLRHPYPEEDLVRILEQYRMHVLVSGEKIISY